MDVRLEHERRAARAQAGREPLDERTADSDKGARMGKSPTGCREEPARRRRHGSRLRH